MKLHTSSQLITWLCIHKHINLNLEEGEMLVGNLRSNGIDIVCSGTDLYLCYKGGCVEATIDEVVAKTLQLARGEFSIKVLDKLHRKLSMKSGM